MRPDMMRGGEGAPCATDNEEGSAYFLNGMYHDDLDGDDVEDYLETHGCLPRLRVWTAGLLHPRRHSRDLSWAGLHDFAYSPLH